MLARDINSNPTQYRTWIVNGAPDYAAQFYAGYKSGNNSLVDVTAYTITDDNVIADFNLPRPYVWVDPDHAEVQEDYASHKVLPQEISDSQLAIINGHAYLFGSKVSNKIWRADLNNPADWVDTGATLPTKLYGSSLAIVDGYIYLFGGNNGEFEHNEGNGAVDTIFSAPVSNPLNWTNHGSLLPRRLFSSQLYMGNGSLYLFGGQEINSASDVIFTASTSNPLVWTDTGSRLPDHMYGSTLVEINNYLYLLGGQFFYDSPTSNIYRATVANPTSWSAFSNLPYAMSFCQAVTFGDLADGYVYLYGQGQGAPPYGDTRIVRAHLNDPSTWVDVVTVGGVTVVPGFGVIPAVISHSQLAVIYDRFWLFGGSGQSGIFTNWQYLKYDYYNPDVVAYATTTRTTFRATDNKNNPFQALGFPYWKTDFGPIIF